MYRYISKKEILFASELGLYVTYGVQALEQSPGGWIQRGFVSDVAADPSVTEALAQRFTLAQLSPLHLDDVILDLLDS